MKDELKNIRPHALSILLVFILISTILTSYSMYTNKQSIQSQQDTKQKIRTLLESISPEILQRIDAGRKKILVCISTQDAVKLSNLSKRVDFDKYLSVKQITIEDDSNGLEDPNIFIENDEYIWVNNGHYLYPKDALIK